MTLYDALQIWLAFFLVLVLGAMTTAFVTMVNDYRAARRHERRIRNIINRG